MGFWVAYLLEVNTKSPADSEGNLKHLSIFDRLEKK